MINFTNLGSRCFIPGTMNMCKLLFGFVFHLFLLQPEYSKGSTSSQNDDDCSQANEFIEKYRNIENSKEKLGALKEFVRRKDAEKEIAVNETIIAKEAEKVQAVNEMQTKMALGTFLCAMSFMEAAVEFVYREEVEKCSPWKKDSRPTKIKTDEIFNERAEPHYQKWLGFLHQNSSKNHIGKLIRERIPEGQYMDFAWCMPKIYFFCKDYVRGRRALSLKRYRNLRQASINKSVLEFVREHSRWVLTKKDLDFVNVLLDAAGLNQVGYEWLDKGENYVLPFSPVENCWPTDRYFFHKYKGVRDELNKVKKKEPTDDVDEKPAIRDELNEVKTKQPTDDDVEKPTRDEVKKVKTKQPTYDDDVYDVQPTYDDVEQSASTPSELIDNNYEYYL